MKFAQTVVSEFGFRDPDHNPTRLAHLASLLPRLAADGVDVVALPAGFLTVRSEADVASAAADVADLAERYGVGVVAGVDTPATGGKADPDVDALVRAGRLPYFGFAAFPLAVDPEVPIWRQASSTSGNADAAPDAALPDRGRVVRAGGRKVAVLLCGELFSWRAREAVALVTPELVVDLGHAGMGQGLIPAMTNLAKLTGCPVAHSQHLAGWAGRALHFVTAAGGQESVSTDSAPYVGDDDFWIGWRVRDVCPLSGRG